MLSDKAESFRSTASMLAYVASPEDGGGYTEWCENYFDELSPTDQMNLVENIASIAASAASLLCALLNRQRE